MFLPYLRSSAHPPTLNDILTLQSPVVTCTAQCSLYVPHSGHYMYRTLVTICTAQWSQHLPHSSHYMYRTVVIMNRTVVTICTAQLLQHVPHSGHYVPHSGHHMYRQHCPHSVFMCFVWIWEQTEGISCTALILQLTFVLLVKLIVIWRWVWMGLAREGQAVETWQLSNKQTNVF